jgi:DoxX.
MTNNWLKRNTIKLKTFMRISFGVVWLIDGSFKFSPNLPAAFPQMIASAEMGQPSWLQPWFNFWLNIVSQNPAIWVYLVGVSEVLLGLALILGLMRKVAYIGGMILSLLIWAVPEGFGGPYGPTSTDIGTGIIYSFVFIFLLLINATYGPSKYSIDYLIEKRFPQWAKVAEAS